MSVRYERQGAQGDVFVRRLTALPDGLERVAPGDGEHVVAHSETGHDHVVRGDAEHWRDPRNPTVCYLAVGEGEADLVHLRPWDTHVTHHWSAGVYEVRRGREYVPGGWRRTED